MPFIHGKNASVFFGSFNLSPFLNNATFTGTVETGETTTFGAASKSYLAGLKDGTVSLAGLFDAATGAIDPVMATLSGVDNVPLTVCPQGAGTLGNRSELAIGELTSYEVTTPVADVVSVSAEVQASEGVEYGVVLATHTARTTTENTTGVDNGASSANGGVGVLHVTANTRNGSPTTVKVQHSTDNVTFTDLITFTNIGTSAVTSERLTVSGTVNRYVRHSMSVIGGTTGSITYTVSFARR